MNGYLVKLRYDFARFDVIVLAKTEKGAIGKARRAYPYYEYIGVESYVILK